MKKMRLECILYLGLILLNACSKQDPNSEQPSPPQPTPNISITEMPTQSGPDEGGTSVISFMAVDKWSASVNTARSDNWCSIYPTSGDAGLANITVTSKANETYEERSATIIIICGSQEKAVTVSQKQKDVIIITDKEIEISSEGGLVTIPIQSNVHYSYSIQDNISWISPISPRNLATSSASFNIESNNKTEIRKGVITFTFGALEEKVVISQNALDSTEKVLDGSASQTTQNDYNL